MVTQWIMSVLGILISAIIGLAIWRLQRRIDKSEQNRQEIEKARKINEILLIKGNSASIALGEATALALKHGKCNGETEKALSYARQVKHEQKDFLYEQGIMALY